MRIFGVMMVRNEADILRINILHHRRQGIEELLVLDNGSRDATPQILDRMARRFPSISWSRYDGPYRQSEMLTHLARMAACEGADWIVPIDADEFWTGVRRSLADVLETSEAVALEVGVVNFVQRRRRRRSSERGLLTMTRRAANTLGPVEQSRRLVTEIAVPFVEVSYPPKWVFRASPEVVIGTGNHVLYDLAGPSVATEEIVCLHAPLRSRETLDKKAEHGRRVLEAGRPNGEGWHVLRWRDLCDRGELEREWRANSYRRGALDNGRSVKLVTDLRLRQALEGHVRGAAFTRLIPAR